jgi:hypothetical protein
MYDFFGNSFVSLTKLFRSHCPCMYFIFFSEPLLTVQCEQVDTDASLVGDALMNHATVPTAVKYGIPVVIAATMALFLSSNLSVGAATFPVITVDGYGTYHLPATFDFSLSNTIREMYQAGVYALMLMVGIFSGIWPYVKLFMMFLSWVLPTNRMGSERRGALLVWLDSLNKYSLVDTFVLILMTVVFRIHMQFSAPSSWTIDTYVEPLYGFYSFLAATVASLIMGEVVLYMHRNARHEHVASVVQEEQGVRPLKIGGGSKPVT